LTEPAKYESWGILEIMGHSRFAGKLSSEVIGGVNFVRVDVPDLPDDGYGGGELPAFTKYFTQAAIFSMTPTTEEVARSAAQQFRSRPATVYSPPRLTVGDPDDDEEF